MAGGLLPAHELPVQLHAVAGVAAGPAAYVWDGTDVEWARREYLLWTKRHAVAEGGTLWTTRHGFKLTEVEVANPAQPAERTGLSSIGTPMHVATRGQIAYVAAGSEGLYVVNLAAPGAPAILTRLTPPGRMLGCDVAGNRLAVAALEGGCTCTTSLRRPLRCS